LMKSTRSYMEGPILTPKWSSLISRFEPVFLNGSFNCPNSGKRDSLSIRRSRGNAPPTLLWPGILSPTLFTIDTNFFRMQNFEALPLLKRRNRRSLLARTPLFRPMILDFYGLILKAILHDGASPANNENILKAGVKVMVTKPVSVIGYGYV